MVFPPDGVGGLGRKEKYRKEKKKKECLKKKKMARAPRLVVEIWTKNSRI